MPPKRSLFVLSLPRSLSSEVHGWCRDGLSLQVPDWTTCGEILNNDRFVMYGGHREDQGLKFTTAGDPAAFGQMQSFLDHVVQKTSWCYKDVVQPFVASTWLCKNARSATPLAVLRILPDVAHVASRMLAKRWHYPLPVARRDLPLAERIVVALLAAERAVMAAPGEAVGYDDLMDDPQVLWDALARLYPDSRIEAFDYRDAYFLDAREALRRSRETSDYAALSHLVGDFRSGGRDIDTLLAPYDTPGAPTSSQQQLPGWKGKMSRMNSKIRHVIRI